MRPTFIENAPRELDPIVYAGKPYQDLIIEISQGISPHRKITYVPYAEEQSIDGTANFTYATSTELPEVINEADAIIVISRDEEPNPSYTDQYPDYNVALPPSARSNVDTSVALAKLRSPEKDNIPLIVTGRMHNRAVRAMLALPILAEHIGINAEDFYHTPEETFKRTLEDRLSHKNVASLRLDPTDPELGAHHKALLSLLESAQGTTLEDTSHIDTEAVWDEYKIYPRVSTSRLMLERAARQGVLLGDLYEEDGAVDTITNLINVAEMLQSEDFIHKNVRRVVIVAGSDHLPRTMWIANHILPDDIEIVCVESDPALDQDAYDASCDRELKSWRKGSVWIGGTRDLTELGAITDKGYFGVERVEAAELAQQVATTTTRQLGATSMTHIEK